MVIVLNLLNMPLPDSDLHVLTTIQSAFRSSNQVERNQGASESVERVQLLLDQLSEVHTFLNKVHDTIKLWKEQINYEDCLTIVGQKWDECTNILDTIDKIQKLLDTDEHNHLALVIMRIQEYERKKLDLMMLQLASVDTTNQQHLHPNDLNTRLEEASKKSAC